MKRIVFGLSLVLMLVQNGFAYTNAEYNQWIKETNIQWKKQAFKCEMLANNYKMTADVNECIKAVSLMENSHSIEAKKFLPSMFLNTGGLFYYKGNKLKAYEYWMKSAKLGYIQAQKNLDIMCKESPWACK